MDKKNGYKEIIKNTIRQCPGFKANQDLFEEMLEESSKRLESFLETSTSQTSEEVYIKKIVKTVVIDIIKDSEKIRVEKAKKEEEKNNFQTVESLYKTDEQGRIIYDIDPEALLQEKNTLLSDERIDSIKDKIQKLNEQDYSGKYRKIFEKRFLEGLNYLEITEQLELQDKEVLKVLQVFYEEINTVLTT